MPEWRLWGAGPDPRILDKSFPEFPRPTQPDHARKTICDNMSLGAAPIAGRWEPAPSPEHQLPTDVTSTVCRLYVQVIASRDDNFPDADLNEAARAADAARACCPQDCLNQAIVGS